jgi:O-antigen biosynthesis protein
MFEKDSLLMPDKSLHSPHILIPGLIKDDDLKILDVGCNTGIIGRKIMERKGMMVDGIDINTEALKEAGKYYRKVFKRELSQAGFKIDDEKYDYIIFSDILEHLPQPNLILIDAKKYLKKDGRIIVSLPNIARFEIRLELLFGKFEYKPGILGEDHLRFFTRKSAAKMINSCGYKVKKIIPTGLGHKIGVFLDLTAFQFIYVCEKKDN